MFRAGHCLDGLEMIKNHIFAQNINNVCAVCLQQHENYRTSSMQDMLSAQDKIEVYKVLESISLFKYSEKTPQLLCSTCSFKLLSIYEFQQTCNKSYFYFINYINQKDTQDTYELEHGDAEHLETNTENSKFIEEVRDNNFLQERVVNKPKLDLISEILPLTNTNEKNDISRIEDPGVEDDACKLEIGDIKIHDLNSDSEEDIKSIQKSSPEIQANTSTELTVIELAHQQDRHSKEHLGISKKECYIDLNKDVQNFKCTFCGATFMSNHALLYHKQAYKAGRQFKCNQCGKTFATCYYLKEHTKIHTTEQLFSCEVCAKQFKEEQAFTSHMVTHTNTNSHFKDADIISRASQGTENASLESEIVRAGTTEEDGVANESTRIKDQAGAEHGVNPKELLGLDKKENCIDAKQSTNNEFVCKYCNKVLCTKVTLISHENLHEGNKPYKCDQCPKAYVSNWQLNYHKLSHKTERPFVCDICAKTFKDMQGLKVHIKRVHKSFNTDDNVTKDKKESCFDARKGRITEFVCKYCNKVFGRKQSLIDHENLHTGEKPYKCDQCTQAFASFNSLYMHKVTHNPERRACCEICGKTFQQKGALTKHLVHHANARSHVCSICNKGFNHKVSLLKHIRSHNYQDNKSVPKPYTCDQCPKAYFSQSGLAYHKVGHTTEWPCVCDICAKRFRDKSSLTQHRKCHVNARPHVCSTCGRSFNSKNNMMRHIRCMHNNGNNDPTEPKINIKKS